MPNTPNSQPRTRFQAACPGTTTSAIASTPSAATRMLPITPERSSRRRVRREAGLPELLLRPDPLLLRAELLRVPELRPAEDGRCAEDFADDLPERDCAMFHVLLKTMSAAKQNAGCLKDFP